MFGAHTIPLDDTGRIEIPADVRARAGMQPGVTLVLMEVPGGLVLMTRGQLNRRAQRELAGVDLVDRLLEERADALDAQAEDRPGQ